MKLLYEARTTFIGAGSPSTFYFTDQKEAQEFIDKQDNGEVEETNILVKGNHHGGTWDDVQHSEFMEYKFIVTCGDKKYAFNNMSDANDKAEKFALHGKTAYISAD